MMHLNAKKSVDNAPTGKDRGTNIPQRRGPSITFDLKTRIRIFFVVFDEGPDAARIRAPAPQ